MFELAAFWVLVIVGARSAERRQRYAAKPGADWLLDLSGLTIQGGVVPLLQIVLVAAVLGALAPELRGSLALPGNDMVVGFALNFIAVDYLYYWNHRLLHTRRLWPAHLVHHTVSEMDVLGTSRNTLWSSFLILYMWINGAMIFLLAEPAGFAAGAALTAALDLWRHSELSPRPGSLPEQTLGRLFVLPSDHAWHHADADRHGNYGANWTLWDRLHGTYLGRRDEPERLGVQTALSLPRKLFWPFS